MINKIDTICLNNTVITFVWIVIVAVCFTFHKRANCLKEQALHAELFKSKNVARDINCLFSNVNEHGTARALLN